MPKQLTRRRIREIIYSDISPWNIIYGMDFYKEYPLPDGYSSPSVEHEYERERYSDNAILVFYITAERDETDKEFETRKQQIAKEKAQKKNSKKKKEQKERETYEKLKAKFEPPKDHLEDKQWSYH